MKEIFQSIRMFVWMTLLTGLAYPLAVTFLGQLFFHDQATGSFVVSEGKIAGSKWIGQSFSSPSYFWPRPSAVNYNPLPSGGSNYSVTHSELQKQVLERIKLWGTEIPPVDLLYASGSGLDPHVSPEGALIQVSRVSKGRNASKSEIEKLVNSMIEPPDGGILGEPRVNVLLLNMELDRKFPGVKR